MSFYREAATSQLLSLANSEHAIKMEQEADLLDIPLNAQHAEDVALPADASERKRVLNILAQRRYRK